jgi:hypothetical protein
VRSQRLLELALKKQMLLLECASQRQQLAQYAEGMQPLFAGADRGIAAMSWVRQHPALVAVAGAAAVVLRPRFLWRMGLRGLYFWRMAQAFRSRR